MMGLQEQFLHSMIKANIPATFYLLNGYQMKGTIKAYDDEAIFVESSGCYQMVFKHALSTIMPHRRVTVDADLD